MNPIDLVERARKWEQEAEAKLAPRLTNTPKRLAQARSAELDGTRLRRASQYMLAIAKALANGGLPPALQNLKPTKDRLVAIGSKETDHCPNGYHSYLIETDKWRDMSPEAVAMRALADGNGHADPDEHALALRRMEDDLRFTQIPGFFPTPGPVIERMLELAEIEEGMTILEPSAGKGDIADAIVARWGNTKILLICCEINPRLREILQAKNHEVLVESNFLLTAINGRRFDRIIMNPPFERGQDVEHVKHAYKLLGEGGKLVAIMANGAAWQKAFPWLDGVSAYSEPIEAGAFAGKEAFRQTGVSCNLVVIDKD